MNQNVVRPSEIVASKFAYSHEDSAQFDLRRRMIGKLEYPIYATTEYQTNVGLLKVEE